MLQGGARGEGCRRGRLPLAPSQRPSPRCHPSARPGRRVFIPSGHFFPAATPPPRRVRAPPRSAPSGTPPSPPRRFGDPGSRPATTRRGPAAGRPPAPPLMRIGPRLTGARTPATPGLEASGSDLPDGKPPPAVAPLCATVQAVCSVVGRVGKGAMRR